LSAGTVEGRTVVVTGASAGTGAQAAAQLAALGARVVVVGRDPWRTAAVADGLGSPSRRVPRHIADFARLDDVSRLAAELLAEHPTIDVLLDNAGAAVPATTPTVDGHEPNYQINALAPFLLTRLLTPALRGGRIVATSSRSHRRAALDPVHPGVQLDRPDGLGAHRRYARAKLAALLLHREHHRRHPDLEIVDVHPGIVASDFGRYLGTTGTVLKHLLRPVLLSPSAAASALASLAAAAHPLPATYYVRHRPGRPAPLVADVGLARAVYRDALQHLRRRSGGSDQ
jgi:NAD(P)-dependent dehydrogenase (short-subunit alcohol dehydrogenase family)